MPIHINNNNVVIIVFLFAKSFYQGLHLLNGRYFSTNKINSTKENVTHFSLTVYILYKCEFVNIAVKNKTENYRPLQED